MAAPASAGPGALLGWGRARVRVCVRVLGEGCASSMATDVNPLQYDGASGTDAGGGVGPADIYIFGGSTDAIPPHVGVPITRRCAKAGVLVDIIH